MKPFVEKILSTLRETGAILRSRQMRTLGQFILSLAKHVPISLSLCALSIPSALLLPARVPHYFSDALRPDEEPSCSAFVSTLAAIFPAFNDTDSLSLAGPGKSRHD